MQPRKHDHRKCCDVHVAAGIQKSALALVEADVTGMIATSLCQTGAGELDRLRECLREIFLEEAVVVLEAPPQGRIQQYREEVFELFLPFPASSQRHHQDPFYKPSKKASVCITAMRRYVLGSMLNSDIESPTITHHCVFGCCASYEDTMRKLTTHVVWSLLPTKAPLLVRNKWLRQEDALNWSGLLSSFHGLLGRILLKFTGGPQHPPAPPQKAMPIESGWSFLADDSEHPRLPLPLPAPEFDWGGQEMEHDHGEQPPQDCNESATATAEELPADWAQRNKQYKRKCCLWSQSDPGPRLAVAKQLVNATSTWLHACLRISSKAWERRQIQRSISSGQRSYRIVEAAMDSDTEALLQSLLRMLGKCPSALPCHSMTLSLRSLAFRLPSRTGCSAYVLLRAVRQGCPFRLFKRLLGTMDDCLPVCMQDEFTHMFLEKYPVWNEEAQASLECFAHIVDLDTAGVEAKHGSIRRLVTSKGLQTWVPKADAISAEWCCRMVSTEEFPDWDGTKKRGNSAQKTRVTKQPGKQLGAKGGGGGAWRAFIHCNHKQKKLTKESIKELAAQYRSLSQTEKQFYIHLGSLGMQAWRHGFSAFGGGCSQTPDGPDVTTPDGPGTVRQDGVIVLSDVQEAFQQISLVAFATRDFDADIAEIRRKFRELAKQHRENEQAAMELFKAHSDSCLSKTPDVFEDVPASATFSGGNQGQLVSHATWVPPCSKLAQAGNFQITILTTQLNS